MNFLRSRLGRTHAGRGEDGADRQEGAWYARLAPLRAAIPLHESVTVTLTVPPFVAGLINTKDRISAFRRTAAEVIEDGLIDALELDPSVRLPVLHVMHPRGDGDSRWRPLLHALVPVIPWDGAALHWYELPGRSGALVPHHKAAAERREVCAFLAAHVRERWAAALEQLLKGWGVVAEVAQVEVHVRDLPNEAATMAWFTRELRGFGGWGGLPAQAKNVGYAGAFSPSIWSEVKAFLDGSSTEDPDENPFGEGQDFERPAPSPAKAEEPPPRLLIELTHEERTPHIAAAIGKHSAWLTRLLPQTPGMPTPDLGSYAPSFVLGLAIKRRKWGDPRDEYDLPTDTGPLLRELVWHFHLQDAKARGDLRCGCCVCKPLDALVARMVAQPAALPPGVVRFHVGEVPVAAPTVSQGAQTPAPDHVFAWDDREVDPQPASFDEWLEMADPEEV